MSEKLISKWHNELDIFSKITPLIIIDGNILDSYQYPTNQAIVRLNEYLYYYYKDQGYKNIVFYDLMEGFFNEIDNESTKRFAKMLGVNTANKNGVETISAQFKGRGGAATMVERALTQTKESTVVIMSLASRYIIEPLRIDIEEVSAFTSITKGSLNAREVREEDNTLKNLCLLITNKVNDLPAWFFLENPNVKTISIQTPSKEAREEFIKGVNFKSFFKKSIYEEDIENYKDNPNELEKIQNKFVGLTEGFTFTELNYLRKLCNNEGFKINELTKVIDLYKFGITENPWEKIDPNDWKDGLSDLEVRVKGQRPALNKSLDIVKRAISGLSGLQHSSGSKPKGILFFAGPTGTGKTETAKSLAEKLFGDERACIRFDMSEYSQSHTDQRLLGAPPGYVGYESGGELTNAVKNNPFSILLFDEIEKANRTILDKFLQILEDGRLTDGQGNTVYFSETIIIFTSNLGIIGEVDGKKEQLISMDEKYEIISEKVKKEIERVFKFELGKPELLNRIGLDNVVVFDFIRDEVASLILDSQIKKILNNLKTEKEVIVELSEKARKRLFEFAKGNLEYGGRGVGNAVETNLINPLSRYMFDNSIKKSDKTLVVEDIKVEETIVSLICSYK